MKWLRHRKARSDRDSGMVFAWRGMHGHYGGPLMAAVVVGLCAVALASAIRVRVLSPPAQSQRQGGVMMALDDRVGEWLEVRGADLTPFPGPLDVWGLETTLGALEAHPALSDEVVGVYVPVVRPLPENSSGERLAFGNAGRRVLPALPKPPPPVEPGLAAKRKYRPVLNPDSLDLAARVPVPLPEFDSREDPPEGELRFLVAVTADGRVREVLPLEGSADEGLPMVERWLRQVGFEPVDGGDGWFVVAVRFLSADV